MITNTWMLLLLMMVSTASGASEYFVSPSGTSSGDGSRGRPWDFKTAMAQPALVKPGDTINLLGGLHRVNDPESSLNGTASLPITVRSLPGEWARIDLNGTGDTINQFLVAGSYTVYRDFEVFNSKPERVTSETGSWDDLRRGGISISRGGTEGGANYCKFINLVVHDTGNGFGYWLGAVNSEIYGCIVYNNGWQAPDRGHGHGFYVQNDTGTKLIADNIVFNNFCYGIQCYGSESAYVNNIRLEGNVFFNAGGLAAGGGGQNILIGGGRPGHDNAAVHNFTYGSGGGARFGYPWCDGVNTNFTVNGNYFCGGVNIDNVNNLTFIDNTVVDDSWICGLDTKRGAVTSGYNWDNNTYYCLESEWQPFGVYTPAQNYGIFWGDWKGLTGLDRNSVYHKAKPERHAVFIRRNKYDDSRATVIVYNWGNEASVAVNMTGAGFKKGDILEVRDVQNYTGEPLSSGIVYDGVSLVLSMTNTDVMQPIGNAPKTAVHTEKEFGIFIVKRTGFEAPESLTIDPAPAAAYPNPWRYRDGEQVKFTNLPSGPRLSLKVYNSRGEIVRSISFDDPGQNGSVSWDGKNDDGAPAGRGIYYCTIEGDTRKSIKVGILK